MKINRELVTKNPISNIIFPIIRRTSDFIIVNRERRIVNRQRIRSLLKLSIVCISIFLASGFGLKAQVDSIIFDTKGKDFWLAYMPNFHNNYSSGWDERSDSIYIFIVADKPTNGIIEFRDRYGNDYIEYFSITNTNEIYTFKQSHYDFEVGSYNRSGEILDASDARNQCERVAPNTFHISADNEVTVYAHSQAVTTSDAFLVYPTDVLGREYLVLSYNSDGSGQPYGYPPTFWLSGNSTPSQFVLVGTENNTRITITPTVETFRHSKAPFNITLNQGEAYLIQAKIKEGNLKSDLTGTFIKSDKPVAVFAGHQRALVPVGNQNLESRDFLAEQMLPISTWGKNAYVIPYVTPPDATSIGDDLFRILIGDDGTDVFINGNNEGRFNKGEFIEKIITGSATIEATGPILVAEFKKTSKLTGISNSPLSDPFMMIVPPKEQFMQSYSMINIQAYEDNGWFNEKVYELHYIAIVAPNNAIDNTYLDGSLLSRNVFQPVQPDTDYYYANIEVTEGPHRISSSSKIGVYIYGYGGANSYGYVGGLSMSQFDFKKPDIQKNDSCYKITGMIYDNRPGDTRIKTVSSPDTSKENVKVKIEPFVPYRDSVGFEATLTDIYLDGSFEIQALDSIGHDTTAIFAIPGFTVSLDTMKNSRKLAVYNYRYRTNVPYSHVFNLRNYGAYQHTISELYLKKNSSYSIIPVAPFDINPGEIFDLELGFYFTQDTVITDTLYISDGCSDRAIMILKLEFKGDDINPKLYVKADSCLNKFDIVITDSLTFDSGIAKITQLTFNCDFRIINRTQIIAVCLIEISDPYKDAFYNITISDSAGNEIVLSDTIQGFTLTMPQFDDTAETKIDYGKEKIGRLYHDTLQIANTGMLNFVIDNLYLKHNIYFSIPQCQLPLIIEPGMNVTVDICFNPVNTFEVFDDTLVLMHNCLSKEVALAGTGDSLIYYGDADCGVKIKTTTHSIDKKYELEKNKPNPVINITTFIFTLPEKGSIKLSIFDILGNERISIIQNDLPQGKHELIVDMESLPQGVYLYTLISQAGILKGTLVKE